MNVCDFPVWQDEFYNDMLTTWCAIHLKEPDNNEMICKQILWHNDFINADGKSLYYQNCDAHNICFCTGYSK
jgi:hypothetical protein